MIPNLKYETPLKLNDRAIDNLERLCDDSGQSAENIVSIALATLALLHDSPNKSYLVITESDPAPAGQYSLDAWAVSVDKPHLEPLLSEGEQYVISTEYVDDGPDEPPHLRLV